MLHSYRATFTGRTRGAIGIVYPIRTICHGETEEQARLSLYEHWDPYFTPKLELMTPEETAKP